MLVLLLALLTAGATPGRNVCSIRSLIAARPTTGMLVLARALPDTVLVPTDTSDFVHADHPSAEVLRARVPAAQRFVAIRVLGDGLEIAPNSTFAAVPWAYTTDCSYTPWEGSARWVPPGVEVLFRINRTRRVEPREPILDVLGWHAPYPTGEFWKYEAYGQDIGPKEEWLTASEYFELILQLPTSEDFANRGETLEAVERVFATSQRWRVTFPGSTILSAYRGR